MPRPRQTRLQILLPRELLVAIEEFQREQPDCLDRTEVMRRLLWAGLQATRSPHTASRRAENPQTAL